MDPAVKPREDEESRGKTKRAAGRRREPRDDEEYSGDDEKSCGMTNGNLRSFLNKI
jgi:hypothetical protein